MNINDFVIPNNHPFGMLEGYSHASEKEKFLAYMLKMSIEEGGFFGIKTIENEDDMVVLGFLEKTSEQEYKLSEKSIKLLYNYYHS